MAAKKKSVKATRKVAAPPAAKRAAKPAARKAAMPRATSKSLKQDIIIEADGRGRTGAQAIAPGHSPRGAVPPVRAPQAAKAVLAAGDLKARVEAFLFRQSELLDNKHWQDWIDLFAEDGVYWMPVTPEQTDWEGEPSIFAEDKPMMEIRMGRVTHPNAWSQAPMWATNHLIGNIVIESANAKEVVVRSRFHMMELRRDDVRHFGGTYRHTLVRAGDSFRIRHQRVDLFNGQAPFHYVLQVWV
ncbi:MAG: aromatic-ring-hydroxylating dioxygenase subunit beta [Burkholderiales bacterium]